MPNYTLRRAWLDVPDRPHDYVFRCDGVDAGRCYLTRADAGQKVWRWTVYGVSSGEDAKREFREAFEAAKH